MRNLAWFAVNTAQALFTASWSAANILAALVLRLLTGGTRLSLAMARRLWAPGLLWGAGARIEAHGIETLDPKGTYFFVCNHQSMIDIPVLFATLPVNLHFIIKDELRKVPFIGWYGLAMGMIFVQRGAGKAALDQVRGAAQLIRSGRSIIAFPEGTRGSGVVQPFKTGVFLPAIEAAVPIVPIAIDGAAKVLPSRGFAVRPGTIRLRIGAPIAPDQLANLDRHEVAQRVRGEVATLFERLACR